MPSLTYLLLSLTSILVTTICTPLEAGAQKPLVIKTPNNTIPGGSTFKYCDESDPENDIFTIGRFFPSLFLSYPHLILTASRSNSMGT
jgi:hypothetical protein